MNFRFLKWVALCLLVLGGVWMLWRGEGWRSEGPAALAGAGAVSSSPVAPPDTVLLTDPGRVSEGEARTNRLAWRLSNTTRSLDELQRDGRAVLLENALIDTRAPVGFQIPAHLQSRGEPGAYIVQSRGPVNGAFRSLLLDAGAPADTFQNYIPNNAYLARLTPAAAESLKGSPLVAAVLAYEPYYKIQMALLGAAVRQKPAAEGTQLKLGLFTDGAAQTIGQIESQPGMRIVAREQSPFGPVVRVELAGGADWTALATLPGVQIVEPVYRRVAANDLSRVTVGVATNTTTTANYLNLTGQNVLVALNDTGVDATQPDLATGRVLGLTPTDLVDTNGHGTFDAGIIAGNGARSLTTMVGGMQMAEGSVSNADFRGKAPAARLFSVNLNNSDQAMQEAAALTNALIDNNSWGYGGDHAYDLAAASWDAAVRDALPAVMGSQPILPVFAAGNDGYLGQNGANGDDNGGSVTPGTITSPGTAKDVITVTALEQMRNITNVVTDVNSNMSPVWAPATDTGYQVASYSARGNVGVGIEGRTGRLKPDVAAPGSFVVSLRSAQWATNVYYNPTNYSDNAYTGQTVGAGGINYYSLPVPVNAVSVTVQVVANHNSPKPFPNMPVYVSQYNFPDPADPTSYDFLKTNQVAIPPDGPGSYLTTIQGTGFNFAVANPYGQTVSYDVFTEVATTNDLGNYYPVLEGMNDSLGGSYRYESGTSMAAADVSGVLALIQDFFTNTLQRIPSPALLKAMLINGARPTLPTYNFRANSPINHEGWGLISLTNSLPTNSPASYNGGAASTIFLQDQSRTNALATGDSHTLALTVSTNMSNLPLRLTLAWTDPAGDPVAAIKLVNSLQLVVTNLDNPTNPLVYYGNNLLPGGYSPGQPPTNSVSLDTINNVQNIILPQPLGTNYVVAVIGRAVNVNAVTAQTNTYAGNVTPTPAYAPNVVQDYALVITAGDPFTVTDQGIVSNPTGDQNITYVVSTNAVLNNQMVGANSPVLNTNAVSFVANLAYGNAAQDTLGTTNQWHFYVVTNNAVHGDGTYNDITNAAVVILTPETLSVSRMGVRAGALTNAIQPQANIDLFVTTDPTLTNLNALVISNCINGPVAGATAGGVFYGASLGRGGAKFVVDTNSTHGEIYYVGVKSEDQLAAEYSFLPTFTSAPFSLMQNGNEILTGFPLPSAIPEGNPDVPGFVDVVAIALNPVTVGGIVVTNVIQQTSVGDLVAALDFNNIPVVLMNHNSPNTVGTFTFVYDDSGAPLAGSQPSAGPGSLQDFLGQNVSSGVWVFHVANSVAPFSGSVLGLNIMIVPQVPLTTGITNTLAAGKWAYYSVDVPAGATNLTISATNLNGTLNGSQILPLDVFVKLGAQPTTNNFDKMMVVPTTPPPPPPPGSSLTIGPGDVPPLEPGRYWVGVFNPNPPGSPDQTFSLFATILPPNPGVVTTDFAAGGSTAILDDAVSYSDIFVATNLPIASLNVGIQVQHPRISDLVFHLIGPDGTRVLLMENRGGVSTNGAGVSVVVTNVVVGGSVTTTNSLNQATPGEYGAGQSVAGWTVGLNQVSLVNDPVNAAPSSSNLLALASGSLAATFPTVTGLTYTVKFNYRGPGIADWWRGENNAADSIGGNNGILNNGVTYTNGKVNQNFSLNGASQYVGVPQTPSLNSFSNQMSIDFWMYANPANAMNSFQGLVTSDYYGIEVSYGFSANTGVNWYINTQTGAYLISNVNGGGIPVSSGAWHHIAGTYDSRKLQMYIDGQPAGNAEPASGNILPMVGGDFLAIGSDDGRANYCPCTGRYFWGLIDEASIYRRGLSASEIKAIYQKGTAGKFDPAMFATSPASSLAEAQVSLIGQSTVSLYGNNTNWQTYTNTFTATASQTTLVLAGLQPGMLLGPLTLTGPVLVTNVVTNIYYLTFTENTNLTVTPIKFAPPPFTPATITSNVFNDGFEQATAGDYTSGSKFGNGWSVTGNQVSIVSDATTAYAGSNFVALASGVLSNTLPTVAGNTYTLTFAYRGPSIAAWWRAENNTNDVINGNNPIAVNNIGFLNGEVGRAYSFDGSSSFITMPPSTGLAVTNLTFEGWIYPTTTQYEPIIDYGGAGQPSAAHFWVNGFGLSPVPGMLYANTRPSNVSFQSAGGIVPPNQWSHVAFTLNAMTGKAYLYYNGTQVANNSLPPPVAVSPNFANVNLGYRDAASAEALAGYRFAGGMDEMSIYSRALSPSEIKAIFAKGTAGKFDAGKFAASPASSLAEAQVSLNGQVQDTLYGSNTTWQVETITFTATQTGTPLSIAGLEPGMLLDNFTLTQVPGDLYYQPEQPLTAFNGKSALGDWRLEIQDDRAGAGLTNALLSWNLQFVFANTNAVPLVVSGGIGFTNQFVPAGSIAWYQVNVPVTANYAANRLLFASASVNVWYDTNSPPTTNLIFFSGTSGAKLLSTTNGVPVQPPPNIYQGQTYYLGVQNPNAFTVNYGIEVDFDHGNAPGSGFPAVKITVSGNGTTLAWTASPTAQFQVQWTDDLTQPWFTVKNVITSEDGNFTFTDDGTQTAPLGASRYYRLVQITP